MPYDDPDPTDPTMLIGMSVPANENIHRETASAFASEFSQLGYDEATIYRLFTDPFYAGPHRAWRALGDETTREIIGEHAKFWTGVRAACRISAPDSRNDEVIR